MAEGRQTVWILGAGFSKPLGGPLLPRLLSLASYNDLLAHYPDNGRVRSGEAMAALALYHYGRRYPEGKHLSPTQAVPGSENTSGETVWEHAEQYLDMLDAAARAPESGAATRFYTMMRILRMAPPDKLPLRRVHSAACRLVALECARFIAGASIDAEVWQPYRSWSRGLTENDTIITFNYDLVLEKLNKFEVHLPGGDMSPVAPAPSVFKLHGSVDWRREKTGNRAIFVPARDQGNSKADEFPAWCEDEELAIAAPGPSKRERARELEDLWKEAQKRLYHASAIAFVGYRFPPTDAEAREKLLRAISSNMRKDLYLHTVLGPRTTEPDTARLAALLRNAAKQAWREELPTIPNPPPEGPLFTLHIHPLWTEDFFTVWTPELTVGR